MRSLKIKLFLRLLPSDIFGLSIQKVNAFQVQSVLGVVIFLVFSLFHFCAISVSCPGPENNLEQWAYVFYTTYVKQKGMNCAFTRKST